MAKRFRISNCARIESMGGRGSTALGKALAQAHRWQRMLESGECASITELAAAEKINRVLP